MAGFRRPPCLSVLDTMAAEQTSTSCIHGPARLRRAMPPNKNHNHALTLVGGTAAPGQRAARDRAPRGRARLAAACPVLMLRRRATTCPASRLWAFSALQSSATQASSVREPALEPLVSPPFAPRATAPSNPASPFGHPPSSSCCVASENTLLGVGGRVSLHGRQLGERQQPIDGFGRLDLARVGHTLDVVVMRHSLLLGSFWRV